MVLNDDPLGISAKERERQRDIQAQMANDAFARANGYLNETSAHLGGPLPDYNWRVLTGALHDAGGRVGGDFGTSVSRFNGPAGTAWTGGVAPQDFIPDETQLATIDDLSRMSAPKAAGRSLERSGGGGVSVTKKTKPGQRRY